MFEYEDIYEKTGLTVEEFISTCQSPENLDAHEYHEIICGAEAATYLRMPGGLPPMPLCSEHMFLLLEDGWTFADSVEAVAQVIEEISEVSIDEFFSGNESDD